MKRELLQLARVFLADLIAVDGDPSIRITDIDRITSVRHRGQHVSGALESFTP